MFEGVLKDERELTRWSGEKDIYLHLQSRGRRGEAHGTPGTSRQAEGE
jgi:hypothetical protein